MALNDTKTFSAYPQESGEGAYDNSTDIFKWVFITDVYSSIDANGADPKLADFTQVASAGNYVANSTIANTTWTRGTTDTTLNGDSWSFAADGANPITAKTILIYNDTSADKSALKIVDLTTDNGVTAANTTQGFTYNINASGIYKVSRVV